MNDPVALSLRQFVEAWRTLCAPSPAHTVAAGEGVDYVFSGLPIAFFNAAFVSGRNVSEGELTASARRAIDWAAPKGVPWMFIVTQEALEPGIVAGARLDGCDLAPIMSLTGMIATKVEPVSTIPQGLELERPGDDAGCLAILQVNAAAYDMDMSGGSEVLGRASFWKNHFPVVGRVGGRPVCCAATLMVDGHRYVAWVATLPGEQRKGYADAAMRRSLELAGRAHGERPTVLHATDAGLPVYERMGYATIATHTVFMEKRFI